MKSLSIRCLTGGVLALSLVNVVIAAENNPLTITITGSRTAQTVDESLVPVTVINRQQIEQSSAQNVTDILRATPGISLTSNGGIGSTQSVFLRGTESDHTLVLVDGVRMSSATSGTASFQNIPLAQIERIEIVRGPRSSLYGSDAIGGVIQIITRKPQGEHQSNVSVSAGSHRSQGLSAGIAGNKDKAWYSAQISTFKTDGFDACRAEAATAFGGCFADEPDEDGYRNDSVSIAGGATLSPRVNASFNILHADSDLDFDGTFQNSGEAINQVVGLKLDVAASDTWAISLLAGQSKDHSDNFLDGVFSSRFDTDRDQLGIQNDIRLGATGLLTFGVDYYDDSVSGTTEYTISDRDNTGIYAQYQDTLGAHDIQLSLRSDDNEQFGSETTGGINVGHDFGNNVRLTAGYGTAFKAPTFNELFFPDFGNPNLEIETSESIDVGLDWKSDKASVSVNVFDTKIDNLIAFDAASNAPLNVDKARIQGIEFSLTSQVAGWDVNAGLTFLEPEDASEGSNDGNNLARRPKQLADLSLARSWNDLSLAINMHHQGSSFDDLANTKRLDSFMTLGANISYLLSPSWSASLALNNLLDEEYETAEYYNQDGFNGLLTLSYTGK